MRALYQRLKELSKDDFESLVDQLLQAKYPGAGITRVDGSSGDQGIDAFQGILNGRPAVWQAKHFPNRIGKHQKPQILQSLAAALQNRDLSRWTLCVPIDLKINEHEWFQKSVVAANQERAAIELMQASHIVHELISRRTLREAFFPDAIQDSTRLKQLVTNTENLDEHDRATLAQEFGQQYIDALQQKDPRLTYELLIGGFRGPSLPGFRPGAIMSIFNGGQTLYAYPYDIQALKRDPLRLSINLRQEASKRAQEVQRTGKPQRFVREEIASIHTNIAALQDFLKLSTDSMTLEMGSQELDPAKIYPARITFGTGDDKVVYEYVPFKVEHRGTEQITIAASGTIPFTLRIEINLSAPFGSSFVLLPEFVGRDIHEIHKTMLALRTLEQTGQFELSSLEHGGLVMAGSEAKLTGWKDMESFAAMIASGVIVAEHFCVLLKLPDDGGYNDELETLVMLKRIATREDFEIENVTVVLTKEESRKDLVLSIIEGQAKPMFFAFPMQETVKFLFGRVIETGPIGLSVDKALVKNARSTRRHYLAAKEGEGVPMTFECNCLARHTQPISPESVFLKSPPR